ncbi:MAG: extradiol ring-cleavage dioxygenase [Chloroflexota bacterium]|nr:extradiol ring-cleavage dioxygenase [Chloroflexota bacterium]
MSAAQPDTIVVVTPHGTLVDGIFSLLNSEIVRGETGQIAFMGGSNHSFTLEFVVDLDLNRAIIENAQALNVPVARVRHDADWVPMHLDFGSATPLWFMGAMFVPQPRVVIACGGPGLGRDDFVRFGLVVRQAAEQLGRRIGLIASADMAHAHREDSPFGFDPAAAEFDAAIVDAVKAQDLGRLLTFDAEWVGRAKTDSFGPLLALHGAIADMPFTGEVLSYEVPTYFGLLCAAYELSV